MKKHAVIIITEQTRRDLVAVIDHRDPVLLRKAAVMLENAPIEEVYDAKQVEPRIIELEQDLEKFREMCRKECEESNAANAGGTDE